ncbi:hypothetical protein D3C71_1791320 [compost metagenome]
MGLAADLGRPEQRHSLGIDRPRMLQGRSIELLDHARRAVVAKEGRFGLHVDHMHRQVRIAPSGIHQVLNCPLGAGRAVEWNQYIMHSVLPADDGGRVVTVTSIVADTRHPH